MAKRDESDRLVYLKFYADRAHDFREELTPEQMGRLFFALFDYLESGELADVGQDLALVYKLEARGVDRSIAKHRELSQERAKAGKKGGQARIAKTQDAADADATAPPADGTTSKMPPRPAYKPSMREVYEMGSEALQFYSAESCDEDAMTTCREDDNLTKADKQFFDSLRQDGWCVDGYPLNQSALYWLFTDTYLDLEAARKAIHKGMTEEENAKRDELAAHKKAFLAFWRASKGWTWIPDGIDPKDFGWEEYSDPTKDGTWKGICEFYDEQYNEFRDNCYERVPVENPGTHRTTYLDNWRVGDKLYTADDGAKAYLDWIFSPEQMAERKEDRRKYLEKQKQTPKAGVV